MRAMQHVAERNHGTCGTARAGVARSAGAGVAIDAVHAGATVSTRIRTTFVYV